METFLQIIHKAIWKIFDILRMEAASVYQSMLEKQSIDYIYQCPILFEFTLYHFAFMKGLC